MRDRMERQIYPESIEDKLYLETNCSLNGNNEKLSQTNDLHEFIHEMKIQYNNLETENKELKRSLHESEQSRSKYYDLYHTTPTGYFSLTENGIINTTNNTGATMLGTDPHNILDNKFINYIASNYRNIFNETMLKSLKFHESESCIVNLNGNAR